MQHQVKHSESCTFGKGRNFKQQFVIVDVRQRDCAEKLVKKGRRGKCDKSKDALTTWEIRLEMAFTCRAGARSVGNQMGARDR